MLLIYHGTIYYIKEYYHRFKKSAVNIKDGLLLIYNVREFISSSIPNLKPYSLSYKPLYYNL